MYFKGIDRKNKSNILQECYLFQLHFNVHCGNIFTCNCTLTLIVERLVRIQINSPYI